MERRLKIRIEELKERLEIVHEKLETLERYTISLENKYVNSGGRRGSLIRPFTFSTNEE